MDRSLVDEYLARTPGSAALFARAAASLPGGSTRTTIFSAPYPPSATRWPPPRDSQRSAT